jgi:hypothetical protein
MLVAILGYPLEIHCLIPPFFVSMLRRSILTKKYKQI